MKIAQIDICFLNPDIIRDCTNPLVVEFRESEINKGGNPREHSRAIVARDPLRDNLFVCVGLDSRRAWGHAYKTIKAAIKNAIYV